LSTSAPDVEDERVRLRARACRIVSTRVPGFRARACWILRTSVSDWEYERKVHDARELSRGGSWRSLAARWSKCDGCAACALRRARVVEYSADSYRLPSSQLGRAIVAVQHCREPLRFCEQARLQCSTFWCTRVSHGGRKMDPRVSSVRKGSVRFRWSLGAPEPKGGEFLCTRVTICVRVLCTRVRNFWVHFFVHARVTRVPKNEHAREQCPTAKC
jgi:hypothetical protein